MTGIMKQMNSATRFRPMPNLKVQYPAGFSSAKLLKRDLSSEAKTAVRQSDMSTFNTRGSKLNFKLLH